MQKNINSEKKNEAGCCKTVESQIVLCWIGGGGKYSAKFTELYDQNYQSIFFCDIYLYLYVLQQTQIIVVLEQDEHLPFKSL